MAFNPEEAFIRGTTHVEKNLNDNEELVYDEKVRKNLQNRLTLDDFKGEEYQGIYNDLDIEKDKRLVGEKETGHRYHTQRGEIMESVLTEQIALNDWLGDAEAQETTKYDDIENGVDTLVEWEDDQEKPIYLAIDFQASDNPNTVDKKYYHIKDHLDNKKGTEIKYYQSELNESRKGPLSNVPKVIISMDPNNVEKLSNLIAPSIKNRALVKELAKHPLQIEIITDAIGQLEAQKEYLESIPGNFKKYQIYKNITQVLNKLEEIIQKKKGLIDKEINFDETLRVAPVKPHMY
jgi:hypothetical protein